MDENNKNYYIKNHNNEQEMMLIQKEKNEEEEDKEDNNINIFNKNPLKNIGKNIIYKDKYIFGIKTHLSDFFFLAINLISLYIILI